MSDEEQSVGNNTFTVDDNQEAELRNYEILKDTDLSKLVKKGVREVGSSAVWSVSSCKHGYGVSLLRDDSLETYWQSDGTQPHTVNVQFRQKTALDCVCLYMDYKADESYTPSRISLRVGNHFHDLKEVEYIKIHECSGWIIVKLQEKVTKKPLRAFLLQIGILQNHQNGRDTHLRQIKVFSPNTTANSADRIISGQATPRFTIVETGMYSTIR